MNCPICKGELEHKDYWYKNFVQCSDHYYCVWSHSERDDEDYWQVSFKIENLTFRQYLSEDGEYLSVSTVDGESLYAQYKNIPLDNNFLKTIKAIMMLS